MEERQREKNMPEGDPPPGLCVSVESKGDQVLWNQHLCKCVELRWSTDFMTYYNTSVLFVNILV